MLKSIAAGERVETLSSLGALHCATAAAAIAQIPVLFAVWRLLEEATVKTHLVKAHPKQRRGQIFQALKPGRSG